MTYKNEYNRQLDAWEKILSEGPLSINEAVTLAGIDNLFLVKQTVAPAMLKLLREHPPMTYAKMIAEVEG